MTSDDLINKIQSFTSWKISVSRDGERVTLKILSRYLILYIKSYRLHDCYKLLLGLIVIHYDRNEQLSMIDRIKIKVQQALHVYELKQTYAIVYKECKII